MFQFPGFTFHKLCIHYTVHGVSHVCFHIRKSPDHWLCAPTRSLSQLITSFIGSWCQGIHHAPFVAWPIQSIYIKVLHLISQRIFLGLLLKYILKLYINSCAIFKEHLEKHGFSKLNRLVNTSVSFEYEVNILLLQFSIERRWSSRRFSYGYLVTTSPQSLTLP